MLFIISLAQAEKIEFQESTRFRLLSEDAPNLVWTCNGSGEVDYFNQKWFDYTGFPRHNPPYTDWSLAIHIEDWPGFLSAWTQTRLAAIPFEREARLKKKDGTYRCHLMRAVPVRNKLGQVINWVGSATDIEDQKRAEHEIFLNVKRLENERDIRENFVNLLTHDLRNPLTAARITAELLQRYDDQIKSRPDLIENIINNVDRANKMIQDLLDANRIRAGEKIFLDLKPVELVSLVKKRSRIFSSFMAIASSCGRPMNSTGTGIKKVSAASSKT